MDDPQNIQEKTPLIGPEVRQRGAELSLRRLHPPLKVPGYEQEQFVGRGAFGEVWSAVNCNSGRRVAIKFYSPITQEKSELFQVVLRGESVRIVVSPFLLKHIY